MSFLSQLKFSIGVKLGSSQSGLVSSGGEWKIIPTVVAYNRKIKKVIAVGSEAEKMWGKTPREIEVIYPLQRGGLTETSLISVFLEKNLTEFVLKNEFWPLTQLNSLVYVSFSSHLSLVEKRYLRRLFEKLTFNKVVLIDKLYLALIGMGIDVFQPEGYLLVYLGSQTSYISLISLAGKVMEEYLPFGGNDITQELVHYFLRRYNLRVGWQMMETIKKELGEKEEFNLYGYDISNGKMISLKVKKTELREVVYGSLSRLISKLRSVFNQLPPEFVADVTRNGVFLAGGGSLIIGLKEFISREFKVSVNTFPRPAELVLSGLKEIINQPTKYQKLDFD